MDPDILIKRLVMRAGGSLPVARAMGVPSFQGTLNKLMNGRVGSPKRKTAERIARHFGFPTEAVYDPELADKVAAELGVADGPLDSDDKRGNRTPIQLAPSTLQITENPGRYTTQEKDLRLAEAVSMLARVIASLPRIDRAQLQPLLSMLTSEPEARDEITARVMALLAPKLEYTYQYTWEDMARMVGSRTGKARMTGEQFVSLVDEAQAKHVHLLDVVAPPAVGHG